MALARKAANGRQTSRIDRDARARRPAGAARLGALSPPPLRAPDRALPREKDGRADRLPMGAVYEATMRCNLHCEFCYVGDLLNIEGEWRAGADARRAAPGVPRSAGLPGQPHRRRDLHAQGHHVRAGSLPREGLRLRLPDDQRHDHQRGARRGAGRSRGGRASSSTSASRSTARASCTTRARAEGHVRAHVRRAAPAAGRRRGASTRRCASASTRRSRTRASRRSTRWSTSPRSSASTPSASIT